MPIVDEEQSSRYFSQLPVHIARVGRPPGTRNRISSTAKQNIQAVFDGLGGWESMLEWAMENRTKFYGEVYPRMLANEGVTKGSGDIRVLVYAPSYSDKPLDAEIVSSMQTPQAEPQAEQNNRVNPESL